MHEFDLISHYFQSRAGQRADVVLGIGDDCALLQPPQQQWLAVSTDTQNEGIHFFAGTPADALGHKSLAVSLSDMAAMGAEPAWIMLSLSLPKPDKAWMEAFCSGFFPLVDQYRLQLIGGNTTRGALSITTHVSGFIPPCQALRRDTAQPGDLIYITGTLGEAGLALQALQGKIPLAPETLAEIKQRLDKPEPRVAAGLALRQIASAAIDISDGLAADLGHILQQSGVGARLALAKLPLTDALKQLPMEMAWQLALSAGDDYELCFTVSPDREARLMQALDGLACGYHCIGVIETKLGLRLVQPSGQLFDLNKAGFQHF